MKPIGLFVPCIWLVVLLLSSNAAGARANGATDHSSNLEACKKAVLLLSSSAAGARANRATGHSNNLEAYKNPDYKKRKWSEAEKFAWDKIRAGQEADFNKRENKTLDPKLPQDRSKRRISPEFLETVLFEQQFREEVTRKGVRIIGAYFPDKLDLEHGHLPWSLELRDSYFEDGLNMNMLQADGNVSFDGSFVAGTLYMIAASISGSLFMGKGVIFKEGVALVGAQIDDSLVMGENAIFNKVALRGARIKGQLSIFGATITGALDMDSTSIGNTLQMEKSLFCNGVILRGARIKGQLSLIGARVAGKLNMSAAQIDGSLLMGGDDRSKEKTIFNEVDLRGAQIKGQLSLIGARVAGKLVMDSALIGDALLMRKGSFTEVTLTFATIGSNLDLRGGTFETLNLAGTTVKGEFLLNQANKSGEQLNLQNTQVGALVDTLDSWPTKVKLNGFTYGQLGGFGQDATDEPYERPADVFIKWLSRNKPFSFQPYQQLATVLRNVGKSSTADKVLFAAKECERQKAKGWAAYLWLSSLRYGIGYGIGLCTFRVLYPATFLVLFGWVWLWFTEEDKRHECAIGRIGLWFSLDYFLPIIRLRDAHYEKVDLSSVARPHFLGRRWYAPVRGYFYVHQIFGYILVLFLIAALTGIVESTP